MKVTLELSTIDLDMDIVMTEEENTALVPTSEDALDLVEILNLTSALEQWSSQAMDQLINYHLNRNNIIGSIQDHGMLAAPSTGKEPQEGGNDDISKAIRLWDKKMMTNSKTMLEMLGSHYNMLERVMEDEFVLEDDDEDS